MGHPWHSLTELLLTPGDVPEGRLREAWEETAGRLGLVRLGWIPDGDPGGGNDEALSERSSQVSTGIDCASDTSQQLLRGAKRVDVDSVAFEVSEADVPKGASDLSLKLERICDLVIV